jgi:TatD DNase family protein
MADQSFELVDTHSHIQVDDFSSDVDQVVERARGEGVNKIIVVGGAGDLSSNDSAVRLSKRYPGLFATVGMHPHDARDVGENELSSLRKLAQDPKVVAVGETGLDFYYGHSPKQTQMDLFRRFIRMARETGLPLVVHNRESDREVTDLIRTEGEGEVRGVIHCFTGDFETAESFLDLGFYLSFGGIVTFKNAETLRGVVQRVPLDRMLVETDAPYLSPVPHRGKRNEPAYVRFVAEAIARARGIALEEVARVTSLNAKALFGI